MPFICARVLAKGKLYHVKWLVFNKSVEEISNTIDGIAIMAEHDFPAFDVNLDIFPAASIEAILIERVVDG